MICLLLAALCYPSGCRNRADQATPDQPEQRPINIYTVNYPLKYFADRIGGEVVDVVFPAPDDEDPAFWTPDSQTVVAYQQADLILLNGADYAKWVSRATLPRSKLVDTSRSFESRYIVIADAIRHSHGPGAEHSHGEVAFTTWLDPQLAIAQAEAIHQALGEARPALQALFDGNYRSLEKDLLALDDRFRKAVGAGKSRPIVFSHPVFQYLQRRYQLNGQSVHWEPGEIPSAEAWNAFAELLETHPAGWMIWESEPLQENVDRLSKLGVRSMVFDPCGNRPKSGDWLDVMNRNAEAVAIVFATAD